MTPDRIRAVAWDAVERPTPQHLHLIRLRNAFRDMPAGMAARMIADALDAAYGPELGAAIAACVPVEKGDEYGL